MKCPKCGYENDDNAYFCEGCGNRLKGNVGVNDNQADNENFELDENLDFDSNMNYESINKLKSEDNSSFDYYDDYNKNVSYENLQNNYPKPPKSNKNLLITVIVVIAIAVIAICVCIFLIFFNDKESNSSDLAAQETLTTVTTVTTNTETTTQETTFAIVDKSTNTIMPNLYHRYVDEATKQLQEKNINNYKVIYEDSDFVKDFVIRQSPSSGEVVNINQPVTIYVSKGDPEDVDSYDDEVYYSDYIIPYSSSREISESDLYELNKDDLNTAINEIYAREHRKFDNSGIQRYFNKKSWYTGYIEPDKFKDSMLTDIEKVNINIIVKYMKKKGYR